MSGAKRMIEAEESRRGAAISIAVAAKVLKRCEYHDDILIGGPAEIQSAYKLGSARVKAGRYRGTFASQREMTDAVKAAVDEHPLDYCPRCAKMLDKD